MPELPEVETTRRGIVPLIVHQTVSGVTVRQPSLRWPVPGFLSRSLPGLSFESVERRGKYLLLHTMAGAVLIHLGMSGSLRIVDNLTPAGKHDHVDIQFENDSVLRFTDPRRFGCILWSPAPAGMHPLLATLGPEPLTDAFSGRYLKTKSRGKKSPIKQFIMNSHVVVGVGNIYANESLYGAGIHPSRAAGNISLARMERLSEQIKTVLSDAIRVGGTTLRDFTDSDGKPGYFKQSLQVYGRSGEACNHCGAHLREIRLGQRSTVFCRKCQT